MPTVNSNFKKALYLLITIALTLGFSLSLQSILAAWTAPTTNPPEDNLYPPLTEGPEEQIKQGKLGLNLNPATDSVNHELVVKDTTGDAGIYIWGDSQNAELDLGDGSKHWAIYNDLTDSGELRFWHPDGPDDKNILTLNPASGLMQVKGRIKADPPTENDDVATRGWVNAQSGAASGGGAILVVGGLNEDLPGCPVGYVLGYLGYWNCSVDGEPSQCFCGDYRAYHFGGSGSYNDYESEHEDGIGYYRCGFCVPASAGSVEDDTDGDGFKDYSSIAYLEKYGGPDGDLRGIDLDENYPNSTAGETGTIIYVTTDNHSGYFDSNNDGNARPELDQFCVNYKPSELECNNIHAFISVNENDEIRDMPNNYGYNPYRPVYWYNSSDKTLTKLAQNWNDMLDGKIFASQPEGGNVWTGSYEDGSLKSSNCLHWTSGNCGSVSGGRGYNLTSFSTWLDYDSQNCCANNFYIRCACTP